MLRFNSAIVRVKNSDGDYEPLPALRGYSSYQLAVANGYKGTEDEWMESIIGDGWVGAYQDLEVLVNNAQAAATNAQAAATNAQTAADNAQAAADAQVPRSKLATDTFYNPVKTVAGVTSYDLTAEDVGPMIRTGWNEAITFNITQAVSSTLPVGVTFELLAYGNNENLITLHMPDVQVGVPSEPAFYSSGADAVVTNMLNSVVLKKVNNGSTEIGDVWLVIGNVEVV